MPGDYIDRITSTAAPTGDSLHQLVMDAHRSLNRLQTNIATTYVDGAAAYGLEEDDHALVAAFMAGVHDTEHLKLEHPGLMATATNTNGRLLIENDLGSTSEHVIVVSSRAADRDGDLQRRAPPPPAVLRVPVRRLRRAVVGHARAAAARPSGSTMSRPAGTTRRTGRRSSSTSGISAHAWCS